MDEVGPRRARNATRIEAAMFVKAAVLGRQHGLDEIGRRFAERHGGRGTAAAPANILARRIDHRDRQRLALRHVERALKIGKRAEGERKEAENEGGDGKGSNGEKARVPAARMPAAGGRLFQRRPLARLPRAAKLFAHRIMRVFVVVF